MAQYIFQTDGSYVNFNGGGGLWRLARASNCIAWRFDQTGDLFFDVYDQQYVVKAENIAEVVIDGTPLSAASDFPDAITAVFTGLGGGGSPALGYDVYTALMNDDGEGAYVSSIGAGGPGTPFQNTIGNIVWSKQGTGIFKGTLAGAFPEGKTFFLVQPAISPLSWVLIDWEDENTVKIETKAFSGSWSNSDYTLYLTAIEIRVYP